MFDLFYETNTQPWTYKVLEKKRSLFMQCEVGLSCAATCPPAAAAAAASFCLLSVSTETGYMRMINTWNMFLLETEVT